jgi:thiol:disulfide interchange protein DsbC
MKPPYHSSIRAVLAVLTLAVVSAWADDTQSVAKAVEANPSLVSNATAAATRIPGVKKEDIRPTPVAGVFEVRRGADIVYMSGDGQYVFTGDLYNVSTKNNLTEAHRRLLRQKLIEASPESQMVIFSPPQPKYTVTVFTDVDCAYCRELHRQIADYNRLGVRVRYIFFPRTGPNTASWHKAEQVWCSADRKAALTRAKLGEALDAKPCGATPVAQEYELGKAIGLEGTPGIVAANGAMVGGYLSPQALVDELSQQSATPQTSVQ